VAVVMKRLPDDQRLSSLITEGTATPAMMQELGRLVADFHRRAETSPQIAHYGSLDVVRHNWDENFEQTEPFIGRTLTHRTWSRTREEIERFMRVYAHLFEQRITEGWIKDCHGDLQADDTFINPASGEARVLDCIEFNERFRYSDTMSDIAFLSMDLRVRGRPDMARAFLNAYYDSSADRRNPALLRFYESYRAYVRGKVRSFVIDQEGPSAEEKRAAADEARRFFDLSLADALGLRPRLVLFAGIMGSGKTRQSAELGHRADALVLHSDEVRKQLAGLKPDEEQKVPFGEGIYSAEWTERTYGALIDAARRELATGSSIVLDASWSSGARRAAVRAVTEEYEALFAIVECSAPEVVLRERLSKPRRKVTDGRIELLNDQRAAYEAPDDGEADLVIRIDTSGSFEDAAARVHETLFH
ncbi:MAG TPA: AAA family ATPase, partial [Gemmatimonadota bacterium]|nr:AAA family ATPase [Gemmatimonadota bacterium]